MGASTGLTKSKLQLTTAIEADVIENKTFYSKDKDIKTGTMPDYSKRRTNTIGFSQSFTNTPLVKLSSCTLTTASDGNSYFAAQPLKGYYPGTSYIGITASSLGNAAISNVLSGTTFTSRNGINLSGNMPNNGSISASINPGGTYKIPKGYHSGTGTVKANHKITYIDLGTGQTFNVTSKYSDYKNLTVNNFMVYNVGHATTGNATWHHIYGWDRSYNSSTGVFTCRVKLAEWDDAYGNPARYAYANVSVYLVY